MMESSVSLNESGAAIGECGICDTVSWVVARDLATGWDICQDCVRESLTIDYFLVRNGSLLKIRHPNPTEFKGENDR